jgi:hypothetical protein
LTRTAPIWIQERPSIATIDGLRHPQRLVVAALAGPALPVEVGLDGVTPTLKPSCQSAAGFATPAIRIKAILEGLGSSGLFNHGTQPVNICSTDYRPALRLLGQRIIAAL